MVFVEYGRNPRCDDKPADLRNSPEKIPGEAEVEKHEEMLAWLEQIKDRTPVAATVKTIAQVAKGIIGQTVIGASIPGNIS